MKAGDSRFRRGVHVSLLEENILSHGTDEACAAKISIATWNKSLKSSSLFYVMVSNQFQTGWICIINDLESVLFKP